MKKYKEFVNIEYKIWPFYLMYCLN